MLTNNTMDFDNITNTMLEYGVSRSVAGVMKYMALPEYTKGNTWPEPDLYLGRFHWRPSDPTGSCVHIVGAEAGPAGEGRPYEDFMCLYPWLKPFYTNFELTWRPYWLAYIFVEYWWLPVFSCVLYGIGIVYGQRYFEKRKPWSLRRTLMCWNLLLSVFSIIGLSRMVPVVTHLLMNYDWHENLCFDPWTHAGHNEGGIWIFFFVMSKIFELFDTFFIVVHKKPLIILHWYHHISVLLCCWFYGVYTAPAGIYFCVINYFVHSIMYFYYFLMAAKMKPKWMKPHVITFVQIIQMVIGASITMAGMYLNYTGYPHCYTRPINALPFFVLYFSYLFLFSKFFYERYVSGKGKGKKMKIF